MDFGALLEDLLDKNKSGGDNTPAVKAPESSGPSGDSVLKSFIDGLVNGDDNSVTTGQTTKTMQFMNDLFPQKQGQAQVGITPIAGTQFPTTNSILNQGQLIQGSPPPAKGVGPKGLKDIMKIVDDVKGTAKNSVPHGQGLTAQSPGGGGGGSPGGGVLQNVLKSGGDSGFLPAAGAATDTSIAPVTITPALTEATAGADAAATGATSAASGAVGAASAAGTGASAASTGAAEAGSGVGEALQGAYSWLAALFA